jgi:hypothetical protein
VTARILCPSGAGERLQLRFHGLRCAREDAGCAPPVATSRGPSGAASVDKDRDNLKPNEYLIETLKPLPVIARDISDKLRRQILERNGYTCQVCGAGAGEESLCEPGKKCRLEIDHTIPISQGGTDEEHNLRAVCVWYNKDKSNLKVPTSRDAISAMALIRRQPRDVQLEVYEFLAKKFGPKPVR